MSIYLRGKSWYYDFIHKGQRYTGSFGTVSRTVAKEELARKKAEVVEGRLNPAKARKSPRFDAFAQEYLEWVKANKKPLTYTKAVTVMRTLTATFGTKKLNEITPWHIEQYKKARKETGRLPSTINIELIFLKALLNKAQEWGRLAEHPGKAVKLLRNTHRKTRFLSEEEEACFLPACSPALRKAVEIGLLTGFRRQELTSSSGCFTPTGGCQPRSWHGECGCVLCEERREPHASAGAAAQSASPQCLSGPRRCADRAGERRRPAVGSEQPLTAVSRGLRASKARTLRPARPPAYLRLSPRDGRR
jgi:integrase-like protein